MSNTTFVGVDQALRNTGVCLLTASKTDLFTITPKKLKGPERLAYIRDALVECFTDESIAYGALEQGAYAGSGRVFQLGGVSAVVQLVFFDLGINYAIVAPNQLKTHFVGYADAKKSWIQDAAEKELGWRPNDDEADAYALARIARDVYLDRADHRKAAQVIVRLRERGKLHEVRTTNRANADDTSAGR